MANETHASASDSRILAYIASNPAKELNMAAGLEGTPIHHASDLVRNAIARMQAAPPFFNQEEWNALASYEGVIVSGDPEGRVPENLEADENE